MATHSKAWLLDYYKSIGIEHLKRAEHTWRERKNDQDAQESAQYCREILGEKFNDWELYYQIPFVTIMNPPGHMHPSEMQAKQPIPTPKSSLPNIDWNTQFAALLGPPTPIWIKEQGSKVDDDIPF